MTSTPISDLSPKMLHTLRVLRFHGWNYRDAALALGKTENTLRSRIKQMREKTGLRDRAELAYWLGVQEGRDRTQIEHPFTST